MTKPLSPKQKSPETYDINWWWMVYGEIAKGPTSPRRPKLIKNHKKRRIKLEKNV